jgi:hypothetical protein
MRYLALVFIWTSIGFMAAGLAGVGGCTDVMLDGWQVFTQRGVFAWCDERDRTCVFGLDHDRGAFAPEPNLERVLAQEGL